jgi:hypothetical protein
MASLVNDDAWSVAGALDATAENAECAGECIAEDHLLIDGQEIPACICARCGKTQTPWAWFKDGDAIYCSACARVDPFSNKLWVRARDGDWMDYCRNGSRRSSRDTTS